ncbi:L,D-transpeptidase [Halomonas binhaiensis]|uniref:L,D-transpeptidase n=1 Tax=Halomonas binhaiensis TaxID=2562282 RepID=A0A5C1NG17_9GAMM|nr:L,D-transpeptidase [Halomonas binhaiensis]QEM82186.1 L,D-transpeptidase [Halomonas binhaiensis]
MVTPQLAELPPENGVWVEVDTNTQTMTVWHGDTQAWHCLVSTAANGTGQREDSGQTPLGWHVIRAAIGAEQPVGAVFRGRRPTGEVYDDALGEAYPDRDWILTRILWLSGLERGYNRGGHADSQRRYIYIHGAPPDKPMGEADSHGCIRMRDETLIRLFDEAPPGTPVWIHD